MKNNNSLNQYNNLVYIISKYLLSREKKPYLASFKVTYRCNLACQQCPFYVIDSPDISYEDALFVMDELYNRGNRIIIFEGGEPTLWKDNTYSINDLIIAAKKRFTKVGMTSNGLNPLDLPVDTLWVSIDGFEQTHNFLRGAKVYHKIMHNIQRSNHPKLFAHITINAVNYTEIPELIKYLSSMVRGITVQFYYPYNKKYDLYLDHSERSKTIDRILKLKKSGYPICNSVPALKSLKDNHWTCRDWLIDNANPDGTISQGCYLRGRSDIDCSKCGFSPHTEISLAFSLHLRSICAGYRIFYMN